MGSDRIHLGRKEWEKNLDGEPAGRAGGGELKDKGARLLYLPCLVGRWCNAA